MFLYIYIGNEEQVEESEQIFTEALKSLKKIHGKNTPHNDIAIAMLGLGMCIEAQGGKLYVYLSVYHYFYS